MPLVARLVAYAADVLGLRAAAPAGEPDERLAVAALLVHVARADGIVDRAERERLERLIEPLFGVGPEGIDDVLRRATAYDDEMRDLAALVDALGHAAEADRHRLLAMAYAVAVADGRIHEFEEDLVRRLGELLGLDDAAIVAARDGAVLASPVGGTI